MAQSRSGFQPDCQAGKPDLLATPGRTALGFQALGCQGNGQIDLATLQSPRRCFLSGVPFMASGYIVRHGAMRFLGNYEPEGNAAYLRGNQVIVRSDRGLEVGEVLCEANPRAVGLLTEPTSGKIVRTLNVEDRTALSRVKASERSEFETCQRFVEQRKL